MKITIKTHTMTNKYTYLIDADKKTFEINGIKLDNPNINEAIFVICQLSSTWPNKLENNNIMDGLRCKIIIEDGNEKKSFLFINKFPKDFFMLINYLVEVRSSVSRVI